MAGTTAPLSAARIVAMIRPIFVPILALLFGWVSVKDYGATGDGTTDDYAAIAAAYAAAGTNGVVYFPPGTYRLSAALVPLAGQTIRGAGMRATKLLAPITGGLNTFDVSNANVTILDMEIDGRRSAITGLTPGTGYLGINVTAANCTVERCHIHDTGNHGIYGNACPDLTVRNCRIANEATSEAGQLVFVNAGIFLQGSTTTRALIERNYLTGWAQAIGLWFGVNRSTVALNYLVDNYGYQDTSTLLTNHTTPRSALEDYGASVAAHGYNTFFRNVVVGTTLNCLEIGQGNRGGRYIGNHLERAGRGPSTTTGVVFIVQGSGGETTQDILLDGNTCVGIGDRQDGALLTGQVGNVRVVNGFFSGFSHTATGTPGAIRVSGGGYGGITTEGNTFAGCARAVFVGPAGGGGTAEEVQIIANQTYGSTGAAISLTAGAGHLVERNRLDQSISVSSGVTGGVRILENTLLANAAIDVNAPATIIERNVVAGAASGGSGSVVLQASAHRSVVRRNRISSGMGRAVAFGSGTDYCIVQDNEFLTGAIYTTGMGTHNTIEPNHSATITLAMTLKALGAQTVGTSQATVAHGLGYTPTVIEWSMTSAGTIWKSAASDATNIYLTADAASRTAEVYVR